MKIIRYTLLAAGLAALLFGAFSGELLLILRKAAMICLECIGIG